MIFLNIKSKSAIIALLLFNIAKGQNLIVNPSFEDTISHPTDYGQLERCIGCFDISAGTPDYFYALGSYPVSIPNTFAGFQYARTGNAMTGIISYWNSSLYREYIGVTFINNLDNKKKYCFSMFLKLSALCGYATKDIGIYFEEDTIFANSSDNLPYTPQINNTKGMLVDSPSWSNLSSVYIPKKAEKYAIIGNFLSDANSTYIRVRPFSSNNNTNSAYYYFDDIWLSELKPANAGNDTTLCYEDNMAVTLGLAADYGIVYKWEKMQNGSNETIATTAQLSVLPKEITTYILTATDTTLPAECDCPKITSDTVTVFVSVINECDTIKPLPPPPPPVFEIIIPNIFTPNGDGINDFFVIENIKPNTRVEIYNRWGTLVYESGDYRNDWNGETSPLTPLPKRGELADGVYFVVVVEPNEKARRGILQIMR